MSDASRTSRMHRIGAAATPAVAAHARKPPTKAAAKNALRRRALVQAGFDFSAPGEIVCGVDEAGRGPLAGPVVAAAVILDPARPIPGLDDSKVLPAAKREVLYERIIERSMAWCVASASVDEIDTLNILHATMLAMRRAVDGLAVTPTLARIDGNRCPVLTVRSEAVIGGDALVESISAASILAKVTRDRMLLELHQTFPVYGFDAHAGYGTPQHLEALRVHGPCAHHRRSFAPVRAAHRAADVPAMPQTLAEDCDDDPLIAVAAGDVALPSGRTARPDAS